MEHAPGPLRRSCVPSAPRARPTTYRLPLAAASTALGHSMPTHGVLGGNNVTRVACGASGTVGRWRRTASSPLSRTVQPNSCYTAAYDAGWRSLHLTCQRQPHCGGRGTAPTGSMPAAEALAAAAGVDVGDATSPTSPARVRGTVLSCRGAAARVAAVPLCAARRTPVAVPLQRLRQSGHAAASAVAGGRTGSSFGDSTSRRRAGASSSSSSSSIGASAGGVGVTGATASTGAGGVGYDPRVVTLYDLSDQVVDYEQAWAWQRALVARAAAAADAGTRGSAHAVLLLQHPPVYTLGAGSTTDNLRFPPGSPPIPLYRTERGGEVTYHGPGQLVLYPILDLQCFNPDLHWYLRQLEQAVIEALEDVSGLRGERLQGLTGVWVDGAKVAAIGVRAKRWISYHGLALNVVTDLGPFGRIVPCGIADRPVTSVQRLLEQRAAAEDPFAPPLAAAEGSGEAAAGGAEAEADGMIPLTQATQEDLRRLLARAGMTAPVVTESQPSGLGAGSGDVPGAEPDLDDPFAPAATPPTPVEGALPLGGSTTSGEATSTNSSANSSTESSASRAGPGDASHGGSAGPALAVRSKWSAGEALLLREYGCALLGAFERVFGATLRPADPGELAAL